MKKSTSKPTNTIKETKPTKTTKPIKAELLVRRYLPNDYEWVKELIQKFAKSFNDDFNEQFFKSSIQMRLLDPSFGTFVMDKDGHPCGCAFADTERDPRGVLYGRISNVNVKNEYQNQGVGSALVDESVLFLTALNVPWIWANVNPNNEQMIKMFEHRDFKKMLKVMQLTLDPYNPIPLVDLIQGEIKYRSLLENDIPQVKTLIKALADLFNESFDPFWFDISVEKYFQVPSSRIFVADKMGQILGIAFAETRRDPYGILTGYISNIMVSANARGQGIGKHLMELTTVFLQNLNLTKIWANVNHDNKSMQYMFEKQGYKHKFTVMVKTQEPGGAC